MGQIEEKIKNDLLSQIFTDTFKIYEFIDSRFKLDKDNRTDVIKKINQLNNELTDNRQKISSQKLWFNIVRSCIEISKVKKYSKNHFTYR